jgi:FKBP-type peptidyl-prolyl cis-trans isomerase SlyD
MHLMKITRNTVVTVRYELSATSSGQADVEDTFAYLHGGYGGVLAALEDALEGCDLGAEVSLALPPAEAFGEYDVTLVRVEPRDQVPATAAIGELLEYRIVKVDQDEVWLDANHPYAGKTIYVRCAVLGVRGATPDEVERGAAS